MSPSHQFTEVYQRPDKVQPALSGRGPSDLTVAIGACLMWTLSSCFAWPRRLALSGVDVGLVSLSKKSLATTPIGNGVMPTPKREVVAWQTIHDAMDRLLSGSHPYSAAKLAAKSHAEEA